ncbi:MAG: FRG domain-containing protein [Burkholderiaceae bacterium]|nr:FRG domain-containing protein [Burkholderiaceae bacterium]
MSDALAASRVRDLRVSTWEAFTSYADGHDGWAFRGQTDAHRPLLTSLARRLLQTRTDRSAWREREERAIRVFRRKAHIYLPDRSVLDQMLRCLAMMQHHGAPTRLLDFTKSPFVAAFFALENATGESAVYALDTPRLWASAPRFDPSLTRERIDPQVQGNFERYFAANERALVWVGEPAEMDRRLVAQSGLLVMPGMLDQTLDVQLQAYGDGAPLIERVILDPALRAEAMHQLYRMNITQATLFPDLEGLARSIAYELEEIWGHD